jgi:hypothetical protein
LEEVLKSFDNKIGLFVGLEEGWEEKVDHQGAWNLVEFDIQDGLLA